MLLRSTLLLVLLGILPFVNVRGQSSVKSVIAERIKCSITVESGSLSRGKPSYVLIRIENIFDGDITFRARYSFHLKRNAEDASSRNYQRMGDSYWSPAGIVNKDEQLEVVPHASRTPKPGEPLSYRFPNDLIRLRKGESKLMKVDLTQFPWNDTILSGWPAGSNFAHVPKGSYLLEFVIDSSNEELVSNQVAVSLD